MNKHKFKNKKEQARQNKREELSRSTGILFSQGIDSDDESFPFLKYIINAIILYCSVYGCIISVYYSFELELNYRPAVIVCAVFSLIFSFMYMSQKAKIGVYLGILFSVIVGGLKYFVIINSGLNALVNNILKYIDTKKTLPFLREYTVMYGDEYTAMTVTLCVLAVALMMFVNIFVSERMSLLALFLLTFPAVQSGMYFEFEQSKVALFCIILSWALTAGVKFTNAYNGLTEKAESDGKIKNHTHFYSFRANPQSVSEIAAVWLVFVIAASALIFSFKSGEDEIKINLPTNSIKTSTERTVKNFLSYGFSALFSKESDGSGVGELANTRSISFDGKTDLEVTMVNYRVSRVYLRSFAGFNYNPTALRWDNDGIDFDETKTVFDTSALLLKNDFTTAAKSCRSEHKIKVKVTDPTLLIQGLNVPYYSVTDSALNKKFDFYITAGSSKEQQEQTFTCYTNDYIQSDYSFLLENVEDEKERAALEESLETQELYAKSYGLTVPGNNLETVKNWCEKYSIPHAAIASKNGKQIITNREEIINRVISALETDYEYTLKPGKVPYREDYINYFLNANMKGYCQHFASAAVMILRYCGIPARYAEGYAINNTDFYSGDTLNDENYKDWLTASYDTDVLVKKLNVTDAFGHAWVEVFVEGFGWQPAEATTAAGSDEHRSFLSSLFGGMGGNNGVQYQEPEINPIEEITRPDTEKTADAITIAARIIVISSAGVFIIIFAIKKLRLYKSLNTRSYRRNLMNRYRLLYKRETKRNRRRKNKIALPSKYDIVAFLTLFSENKNYPPAFPAEFEELLFSPREITKEEYKRAVKIIRGLRKATGI